MYKPNSNELGLAKVLTAVNSERAPQTILTLNVKGNTSFTEYFVGIAGVTGNPLSNRMNSSAFDAARDKPSFVISSNSVSGRVGFGERSISNYNKLAKYPVYSAPVVNTPAFPGLTEAESNSAAARSGAPDGTVTVSCNSASVTINVAAEFRFGIDELPTSTRSGDYTAIFDGVYPSSFSQGIQAFSTDVLLHPAVVHGIGGTSLDDVDTNLPILVGKVYGGKTLVAFPFICGTSRKLVFFPDGDGLGVLCVYRLGEGNCSVSGNFTAMRPFMPEGRWYEQSMATKKVHLSFEVSEFVGRPVDHLYVLPQLTTVSVSVVTWNPFISSIYAGTGTEIVNKGDIEEKGVITTFLDVNVDNATITGSISKSEYLALIADGSVVAKPVSKADLAAITKSWEKVSDSVRYRCEISDLSGFSVKTTGMYKTYRDKCTKACRDNDFMDKPYNDEYKWKTVENKLQEVKLTSCISLDSTLLSTAAVIPAVKYDAAGIVTLTEKVSTGQISYVASTGETGVTAADEKHVSELLGTFVGYKIVDDGGILSKMGIVISDYNSILNSSEGVPESMNLRDHSILELISFKELRKTLSNDALVAFVACQVTDMVKTNQGIPRLLKKLSGGTILKQVLPALSKKSE